MVENRLKRMEDLLQNLAKNKQLGLEDIEDDEEEEEEEEQVDENDVPSNISFIHSHSMINVANKKRYRWTGMSYDDGFVT
ncbi:hypothetical protein G6F56_014455 [Rhizopus delemar]|nr:hypothetical protein G6F56_014455 [Rhizopus delemar]